MNEPLFLKIIVVGDSGVGKTSFLNRYCYGNFNKISNPTIGCDFSMKIISNYEGKSLRLQLWDIAGQERFNSVSKLYVRGAVGCLIVADCTSEDSLASALKWKEVVEENCDLIDGKTIPIFLMQNKSDKLEDLGEKKPFQTVEYINGFAKKNKFLGAYQVSVKSDVNIQESMDALLKSVLSSSVLRKTEDNFSVPKNDQGTNPDPKNHKLYDSSQQKPAQRGRQNSGGGCC